MTIVNYVLFYILTISSFFFFGLWGESKHSSIDNGMCILVSVILLITMQIFVILSGLSTWAMLKILLKKEITKFQKKLTIIFPILSTILYIAIALVIHFAKN
ncbi:hypothetical protein IJO12_07135 [bacterium]|nr:hypothetical protein [bacterium]